MNQINRTNDIRKEKAKENKKYSDTLTTTLDLRYTESGGKRIYMLVLDSPLGIQANIQLTNDQIETLLNYDKYFIRRQE